MQCRHNEVVVIIDAYDLFMTDQELGLRSKELMGWNCFEKIKNAAEQLSERLGLQRQPRIELFDVMLRARDTFTLASRWATSCGHAMHMIEFGPGPYGRQSHELALFERLRELSVSCGCPLVFVGGRCRSRRIQRQLLRMADQGDVSIISFSKLLEIEAGDLNRFRASYDLFEIGAATRYHYDRRSGAKSSEMKTARQPRRASAATVDSYQQRAASRRRPRGNRNGTSASSEGKPQSQRQLTSAKPDNDLFDPSLPLIVVIDSENIDGHLFKMHNPNGTEGVELDRNNRMDWMKLRDWIRSTSGTQSTLIAPFFSYFESDEVKRNKVMAFADFLRRNGFDPREIKREGDRQVVDEAIIKMLSSLTRRPANVLLVSHDGGYLPSLNRLYESYSRDGKGRIVLAGFLEQVNVSYQGLGWLKLLDLEHDMKVFNYQLPNRDPNKRKPRPSNSIDDFYAEDFLARSGLFPQLKERGSGA